MNETRASNLANTLINITAMPKPSPRPRPQRADQGEESGDVSYTQASDQARSEDRTESNVSEDSSRNQGGDKESFDQMVRRMSEDKPKQADQTGKADQPEAETPAKETNQQTSDASATEGELAGQVAQMLGLDQVVKPKVSGEGLTLTAVESAESASTALPIPTDQPGAPIQGAQAQQVIQIPAEAQGDQPVVLQLQGQVLQSQKTAADQMITDDQPGPVGDQQVVTGAVQTAAAQTGQTQQTQQVAETLETTTQNSDQQAAGTNPAQQATQTVAPAAEATDQQASSDTGRQEQTDRHTAQQIRFQGDRQRAGGLAEATTVAAGDQPQQNAPGVVAVSEVTDLATAVNRAQASGQGELTLEHVAVESSSAHGPLSAAPSAAAGSAAATQAASLQNQPDVERPVAAQLSNYMRSRNARAGDDLVLRLDPPELGQVRMRLRSDNGELRLILEAQNPRTLTQMQREAPALLERLSENGIDVRRMEFAQSDSQSDGGSESFADLAGREQSQAGNQASSGQGGRGQGQGTSGRQRGGYLSEASSDDPQTGSLADRQQVGDDSINLWM